MWQEHLLWPSLTRGAAGVPRRRNSRALLPADPLHPFLGCAGHPLLDPHNQEHELGHCHPQTPERKGTMLKITPSYYLQTNF